MFLQPTPPEHPDESLWQEIEDVWEAANDLRRMHLRFQCRMRGKPDRRHPDEYTGCPKCKARTGDPLTAWKLEVELDYLCAGVSFDRTVHDFRGDES